MAKNFVFSFSSNPNQQLNKWSSFKIIFYFCKGNECKEYAYFKQKFILTSDSNNTNKGTMDGIQLKYLTGLKAGDKKIFDEIYREYYSSLCFYCLRFVSKPEDAEEIVQVLFLKLWLKREELTINSSFKSYLYKAVQNSSINFINKKQSNGTYREDEFIEIEEPNNNGHELLEEAELDVRIKSAIARLPERRRKIFELSRFGDLKYYQIAETLNISVKTVEIQMSKALKTLRESLKEYL
jgi:RNA polymerase sigma-70 factor (ECF subfamily)